jgi:uncharacterized protein YbaP (TraB family)
MQRVLLRWRVPGLMLWCVMLSAAVRADGPMHVLWELHGKHNTVYLMGSIHVLRPSDYPLAPAVLDAYSNAKSIFMEVDLQEIDSPSVQVELLASARLPEGVTLPAVMGRQRYERAGTLAHGVGVDISIFDAFAPWFVAEAISALQLQQLGFKPQSGVEMFFAEHARSDGKSVAGLETVHDQIALFNALSLDAQSDYLLSSLEEAETLPKEVEDMVHAWQRGDTVWFADQLKTELGKDPKLYQSILVARNKKWVPKIEALLNDDRNYLVIVGTLHLVGQDSVIEMLKKDGIGAAQR